MNFSETLRELLKRHKITQRQLAKWTEISHETICRFLAGTYKPGQSSVEAIAYCYSFSEEERLALFRAARCLPTALVERFLEDERFARECWQHCHNLVGVAMHQRQPRGPMAVTPNYDPDNPPSGPVSKPEVVKD